MNKFLIKKPAGSTLFIQRLYGKQETTTNMVNKTSKRIYLALALSITSCMFAPFPVFAAEPLVKIKMSVDEEPIVPLLAASLGYFADEGVEIVPVRIEDFTDGDYKLQTPLIDGQINAAYHWFNHTVFGARHGLIVKAVMLFNDAPGMTVMVAKRVQDEILSGADFKGRKVAEGAGYGTKSLLTATIAMQAGLPAHSYTPVMTASAGRQEAVLEGLAKGEVDVMTFQEPLTSILMATGEASVLYDLNSRESTTRVLGSSWPAQSLLMAPAYIDAYPERAQKLVNAFVRTMRFVNSHTAEQIAAQLPPSYFSGKDRATEIDFIRHTLPTYAKGDYSIDSDSVEFVINTILNFDFDQSESGQWRASGDVTDIRAEQLFDNQFVSKAMRSIP